MVLPRMSLLPDGGLTDNEVEEEAFAAAAAEAETAAMDRDRRPGAETRLMTWAMSSLKFTV